MPADAEVSDSDEGIRIAGLTSRPLYYRDLKVWDADGRDLAARMWLHGDDLRISVADAGARYPVVVDPTLRGENVQAAAFESYWEPSLNDWSSYAYIGPDDFYNKALELYNGDGEPHLTGAAGRLVDGQQAYHIEKDDQKDIAVQSGIRLVEYKYDYSWPARDWILSYNYPITRKNRAIADRIKIGSSIDSPLMSYITDDPDVTGWYKHWPSSYVYPYNSSEKTFYQPKGEGRGSISKSSGSILFHRADSNTNGLDVFTVPVVIRDSAHQHGFRYGGPVQWRSTPGATMDLIVIAEGAERYTQYPGFLINRYGTTELDVIPLPYQDEVYREYSSYVDGVYGPYDEKALTKRQISTVAMHHPDDFSHGDMGWKVYDPALIPGARNDPYVSDRDGDGSPDLTLFYLREEYVHESTLRGSPRVLSFTDDDNYSQSQLIRGMCIFPGKDEGGFDYPKMVMLRNDNYKVDNGFSLSVSADDGVFANDEFGDIDFVLYDAKYHAPQHGELIFLGDGSFTYVAGPTFAGYDSFKYEYNDGWQRRLATVNLTFDPPDPVIRDDGPYQVAVDGVLEVDASQGLLANDRSEWAGHRLLCDVNHYNRESNNGWLHVNADGSFRYVANWNIADPASTTDQLEYAVYYEGYPNTKWTGTVTIGYEPAPEDDDTLIANDDAYGIASPEAGVAVRFERLLTGNDQGPIQSAKVTKTSDPSHGTVEIRPLVETPMSGLGEPLQEVVTARSEWTELWSRWAARIALTSVDCSPRRRTRCPRLYFR